MDSDIRYVVVIPVLNEAEAIGKVIEELSSIVPVQNIVVIDGGSTDGSKDIVVSKGVKLINQIGKGKVNAIRTAAEMIKDVDYYVFLDGDYTYPAKYVPKLLEVAKNNHFDLVIGRRKYIEKGAQSIIYKFGNWFLTKIFNLLYGIKILDVLSGMYVVRAEVLRELFFESSHFGIESEIVSHVVSTGGRVSEIPIEYRKRLGQKKKLKIVHGVMIFLDMIKLAWKYNPTFFIFFIGSLMLIPGFILGLYVSYHYFFTGIKFYVKGIIAILLTLAGFQSLLLAILSLYMKRAELRILREIRLEKH